MSFSIRAVLSIAACTLFATAFSQDWAKEQVDASPRHLEWIDLKSGDRTVKALIAYPEVSEKATVVIVIHENRGLTDWAMLVADQLAEAGYIAIAPDFLSGLGPDGGKTSDFVDSSKIRDAIYSLTDDQVIGGLDAAFEYGKKLAAGNGKVVVAGFCWGGSRTFQYATRQKGLSAAFVFYGTGPDDADAIKAIKGINCPVYGFYGGRDARVNASIPNSEELMKAAGKMYDPVIYEGAGHGFMRAGQQPGAQEANATARADGWKRGMDILSKIK